MLETSRPYSIKFDRILVPMSKGVSSGRVLEMSFDIARANMSEITAFTVKDERNDLTWSDKVAIVTDAYRDGKERGVKVVPKIRTAPSVKECIVDEINSHSYDLVLMASEKKYPVSPSVFGGLGDYVLKNSRAPVAIVSVGSGEYPYRSILFPASEAVATRASAFLAIQLMKATGSRLVIADLRKFDTSPAHRFASLFENIDLIREKYRGEIVVIRGGEAGDVSSKVGSLSDSEDADVVVTGIRPDGGMKVRIKPSIRSIVRDSRKDVILVKK